MPAVIPTWVPERDGATTEQLVRVGSWTVMLTGTAIVVSAGIFVIYREHRLNLQRRAELRHG